jgi:hypothetical protein
VLLKLTLTYGKGEKPGDSHPIINEWGRAWVAPGPGEPSLSQAWATYTYTYNIKSYIFYEPRTFPNFSLPQNN